MLSYRLKCRKNTESEKPKVGKRKNGKKCFRQNVQCGIVKNQDLLESK